MPEANYDVYFSAQLLPGKAQSEVRERLGTIFGMNANALDRLFSGQAIRVKSSVDQDTAIKYRVAFREAGALVEIRPVEQPNPEADSRREEPSGNASELSLLPANTGSLIDCAAPVQPAPIPDISGMSLSPAGTTIDTNPPPPPAQIDTSGLSAAPANSGSLEAYQIPVNPVRLPDISGLRLELPDD